jgi:hypothetical protein
MYIYGPTHSKWPTKDHLELNTFESFLHFYYIYKTEMTNPPSSIIKQLYFKERKILHELQLQSIKYFTLAELIINWNFIVDC